jgi:hypothetical protein
VVTAAEDQANALVEQVRDRPRPPSPAKLILLLVDSAAA